MHDCTFKGLLFEERIDFATMKLAFNRLNKKKIPGNLALKVAEENRPLRKNLVTLIHKNENINKSVYLEEINKILNDQNPTQNIVCKA